MVKEEKTTIDGFPVRSAKDSKLVTRSKAEEIPANKVTKANSVKKTVTKKRAGSKRGVVKNTTHRKARVKTPVKRPTKTISVSEESLTEEIVSKNRGRGGARSSVRKESVFIEETSDTVLKDEIFGKTKRAHEDFLAPVESFGLSEEVDSGTSEGRVEEVEDNEVADLKAKKKELKKAEKEAKKAKKSKKKPIIIVIVIIILLALIGGGVYLYFWGDSLIKKMTGGNGDIWNAIGTITSDVYEPLKEDENGRTNILIFGTSGYSMDGSNGEDIHDGAQLTDSIMVLSLEQETGDIAMVSLPRDLMAGYTCTATGKINEVYWCANQLGNDENAGAAALQEAVEEILGLDIQYYVHINWGALTSIVDTLGGVTVTLDEDIFDYGWTDAEFRAGVPYTINGEEALGLARARHGTENGDFTRGNSQQKLIIAIKDRLVEKGLGIADILGIVTALGDNVRTNLNISEMKTGAHLLEEFDIDSIRQIPLITDDVYYMSTANINGISYVVPSAGVGAYSQLQSYVKRMMSSNPAAREGAEIEVLNGTGEPGMAAQEKQKLESKGYTVKTIDDAPSGEYQYVEDIEIYDASEGLKPETREALEKLYGIKMKAEAELPNGISGIGYDFIIIVGGNV